MVNLCAAPVDLGSTVQTSKILLSAVCEFMWCQHEISIPAYHRGCHLITQHVLDGCPEILDVKVGLLHVFIRHTSASLTINENADPDVMTDMGMAFDRIAPESWPWTHTCEGPDDMPAHVKASLTESSVSIPIRNGQLLMGTWQGIYLCEHRDRAGSRRLVLTLQGEPVSSV
jgi:secondary thiamine-phosphate synthase enzyme